MAELFGLENINNIINKFLHKEFKIAAELSDEFQAFTTRNTVGYTLAPTQECVDQFLGDAEARFPDVTADPFLWLLFHEVGHIMTEHLWSDADRDYFNAQKNKYFDMGNDEEEEATEDSEPQGYAFIDDEIAADLYHAFADENMATKWAGEYMLTHARKVAKFWAKLQPAILEFYVINDVDTEEE